MEGGPPMFNPGSTSPNLIEGMGGFQLQGFHLLWPGIPSGSQFCRFFRVRSPLLTESLLLSFPVITEMFQFTTFALQRLCIQR